MPTGQLLPTMEIKAEDLPDLKEIIDRIKKPEMNEFDIPAVENPLWTRPDHAYVAQRMQSQYKRVLNLGAFGFVHLFALTRRLQGKLPPKQDLEVTQELIDHKNLILSYNKDFKAEPNDKVVFVTTKPGKLLLCSGFDQITTIGEHVPAYTVDFQKTKPVMVKWEIVEELMEASQKQQWNVPISVRCPSENCRVSRKGYRVLALMPRGESSGSDKRVSPGKLVSWIPKPTARHRIAFQCGYCGNAYLLSGKPREATPDFNETRSTVQAEIEQRLEEKQEQADG